MLTNEIMRKKTNSYYEMKIMSSTGAKQNTIDKLGISILNSMKQLNDLKTRIINSNGKDLQQLIQQFTKVHHEFLNKQKSLFSLEEESEKIDKLKKEVEKFKGEFRTEEIFAKLNLMKEEKIRQSESKDYISMNEQIKMEKQESLKLQLLKQEEKDLQMIEKAMEEINRFAKNISERVLAQGQDIQIAVGNARQIRLKIKDARAELVQTNKYQQDTNKMKILFCILGVVIVLILIMIAIAAKK